MASRKEEKDARRAERIAAEEAENKKHANQQRLLIGGGVLGAVAALALIAVLVLGGGSDNKSGGDTETPNTSVKIPARKISDLNEAAKKAGCEFKTFPSEGREHLGSDTAVNNKYKTNPPTSGSHRPKWAEDGIYATGNEPAKENWVHALEHGRIIYQYAPGTPKKRIDQLQTLFAEPLKGTAGYHQMVLQNNTEMPFEVAAVAWTNYIGCEKFTDASFDALRAFRDRFVDKGPEIVP